MRCGWREIRQSATGIITMLNWKLMSHPINWLTIFVMVVVGVMVVNLGLSSWHSQQANNPAIKL
jgi:hypothetical protein